MTRQQHFGWFLARGFGPHGWGHPYLDWNYRWTSPGLYQQSVRDLEQAGLDLLIIEDAPSLGSASTIDLRVRQAFGGPKHDPLLLAPYLFAATQHLGIVPTVNPAAYLPYTAARQFATLQHLSGHRLGLNVVTDTGSARHFGSAPVLAHDAAYDRAEEWLGGIRDLWRSWDDGALIADPTPTADRPQGRYADGTKLRALRHRGEYFEFDGPLNALPFTEGEPVIVSPGGSGRGLGFAGANSDVQLALAPLDAASIRNYRARIHAAALERGRNPADVTVLFAIQPVLVGSAEEADRLVAASANPDDATVLTIAERQSSDLETDLTSLDFDAPLDLGVFGDHVSRGSIARLVGSHDVETTPLRVLLASMARLGRLSDGSGFVGTASELADLIEDLGENADNDGVLFWGDLHPVTVHRMLDELVPILRRRGILRTEYNPGGLRANLRDF
ncbi:alkanesulfonate monooxygenase SsuD/methylene tetrahydromethanopterin reductase-like flavin-dependent oxidoreductase (luciferase family) [Microbacteriaceae bacterium SG_E_30_P1]|uniref:Alkanesulfonate monooxygenase SsuD/methylene tetrahydromethanopterin reductase-like flavin-dependent oxidoreductase (Luciferase family) n=1 Tax=Antiquaquibacter oligotrophicus TaxID=2880260 RepID=A0ABT6KLG4_9MICO|nr:LLM class flavin-dependent oxidoreductase [Antiquaquibacter oligotrophicus]MDH6180024.1 alkanesulfonate monooxygenase SsuD/methylene tetrahydromethanopterin reductase-like flavin-dependent oxidoreductase (luciferase family) [Antiquaquibacter oligotrophicus]UDF14222.1 LLM class flavin-dependent oxidoreductase [Antiquaquibacter oligotrophicus]